MARRVWLPLAILAALALLIELTSGPPAPAPTPPNAFSFAVLGDAPYYFQEELQYRIVRRALDEHDLSAVIHIGDIFWRPCSDKRFLQTLREFNALRHPVIYTPGDNEWADCWERRVGGFVPRERLAHLRALFFSDPTQSLGRRRIALASQGGEFPEHARWEHRGVVFATVHLIGSWNGTRAFPGRTAEDDAEVKRRTAAAAAWLRETFAAARDASAVVIAFHANPFPDEPSFDNRSWQPFLDVLAEEAARFGKPVLVAQGNDHEFLVDHPIASAKNLTRVQVPGSPDVGWVRVVVRPGPPTQFTFEKSVVPRWKYW